MITDREFSNALDSIERYEARFLAWGLIDRYLDRETIEMLISETSDEDPDEILRGLKARNLVFEVPRSSPPGFRSRMSESVRLFGHLRQLFPNQPWEEGAQLVADFRFLVRPRTFPIRSMALEDVDRMLAQVGLTSLSRSVLEALLGRGSGRQTRTLSRFQVDATLEILEGLRSRNDQACMVTAGTGSGKTLAFYLPVLMSLATDGDLGKGMRVLALYPRKELLKDQLLATIRETRRIRSNCPESPIIRIGAFYGDTPLAAKAPIPKYLNWKRFRDGSVCPFLTCPGKPDESECGGRLVWLDKDRVAGIESLRCEHHNCGEKISDSEFTFIRQSMQAKPPDILFTTTETLNLQMSNEWSRHIFGIGPSAKVRPRLVLLDEAHTYSGSSGAQVAYVLRRWRKQVDSTIMWVGLSATLRNAETFFSTLTGVSADCTREVTPLSEDMEQRGHEYQLLLRGDPASQAALLSTSIQSLMLLLRILDPLGGDNKSNGFFGNKVFAFCDNLDAINRLYRQLLDAEGRNPWGKLKGADQGPLAQLRSESVNGDKVDWVGAQRDTAGQNWWMVDRIRESRSSPIIGRTSSQDSGVASDAEVVVATASLEVGFDDPSVGAVLQHKAPRDLAQFMQRRGRAGRKQEMRPWTVVVLSDYGRDRLTYQSYEQLFDPTLPPKTLPLGNRSIQRMQATCALMDWLASKLVKRTSRKGSTRTDLAKPYSGNDVRERQKIELEFLKGVLENQKIRNDFSKFLMESLDLSDEDIEIILWEGPRSLLLEAIPTAIRRIESNWHIVRDGVGEIQGDRQRKQLPLPEFIPANLFSDLSLPEVEIIPPEDYDEAAGTEESVFLALTEFAPGNVTLRYAVEKNRGIWVDPAESAQNETLDIKESFLLDADLIAQITKPGGEIIDVMRPYSISPQIVDKGVSTTSSGRLNWDVKFTPEAGSLKAVMPEPNPWQAFLNEMDFYLKAGSGGVRVLRYSESGNAEVAIERQGRERYEYRFAADGDSVALGVELDVDGLCLTIKPPPKLEDFKIYDDEKRLRQLRRDYFLFQTKKGMEKKSISVNEFLAGWLGELTLAALAFEGQWSVKSKDKAPNWSKEAWENNLLQAFDRCFQGLRTTDEDDPDSPLRQAVEAAIEQDQVKQVLSKALEDSAQPNDSWIPWLRARFSYTMASGVHSAIQSILPEFDAEHDLIGDLLHLDGGNTEIWLTETTIGGGGILESFFTSYSEDPRRFWSLVSAALEPGENEETSRNLVRIVSHLQDDQLKSLANDFRNSGRTNDSILRWQSMLDKISNLGIPPTHSLSVSMATRIFREGSSSETDSLVKDCLDVWENAEERLGISLDQRTACGVLSKMGRIRTALGRSIPSNDDGANETWVFRVLLSLLWSSPESLRSNSLQMPMRFSQSIPLSERTLVIDQLNDVTLRVSIEGADWRESADAQLAFSGRIILVSLADGEADLKEALLELMADPVEVGVLFSYPSLVGLRRRMGLVEAVLELQEAPQ